MKNKLTAFTLAALIISCIFSFSLHANDFSGLKPIVGIDFRGGYPLSSFRDDVMKDMLVSEEYMKTSNAYGSLHAKFGFSFDGNSRFGQFFPEGVQGIGISTTSFGNHEGIGTPLSVYLFQGGPFKRINRNLSLCYEWNFGISAGWKPSDVVYPRSNIIVGSKVNAYINVGIKAKWDLNDNVALDAGVEITHFSNGNTSFPNPGVNMCGARIGMSYNFGNKKDSSPQKYSELPDSVSFSSRHKLCYDIMAYGAWKKRVYRGGEHPLLLNGHFGVAGLSFAPMYKVCRYFRTGVSADLQWDGSTDQKRRWISGETADDIHFGKASFLRQTALGLSARAELVMPIFSVNAGMGVVLAGPPETRDTYQMINLKTYISSGIYLNVGYRLRNFSKQSNLMLGIGYTFRH